MMKLMIVEDETLCLENLIQLSWRSIDIEVTETARSAVKR